MNGIIPKPWTEFGIIGFTDMLGNTFSLPTTSMFSMIFSVIHIFKALVEFNIVDVHVSKVDSCSKMKWFFLSITEHFILFATTAVFRILALVLLVVYLREIAGIIPVMIFMFVNLIYGYKRRQFWLRIFGVMSLKMKSLRLTSLLQKSVIPGSISVTFNRASKLNIT